MAILAECPSCHRKQSSRNKSCSCGENSTRRAVEEGPILDQLHGLWNQRGRLWAFRSKRPDRRGQRKTSVTKTQDPGEGSRRAMELPTAHDWYLSLEKVKAQADFPTLQINLASFNKEFGNKIVSQIKPSDLGLPAKRKAAGYSDSYIDHEITAARTVVNRASTTTR